MFFVYCDYVGSVAVYVGYGNMSRLENPRRKNLKHTNLRKKYGIVRKVLWFGFNEKCAQTVEVRTIADLHTFIDDPDAHEWACNFTTGGDGGKWCEASKAKAKGRQPWNKGKSTSFETRMKMSISHTGKQLSAATRLKQSQALSGEKNPMFGRKISEETRQKMRKQRTPEQRENIKLAALKRRKLK